MAKFQHDSSRNASLYDHHHFGLQSTSQLLQYNPAPSTFRSAVHQIDEATTSHQERIKIAFINKFATNDDYRLYNFSKETNNNTKDDLNRNATAHQHPNSFESERNHAPTKCVIKRMDIEVDDISLADVARLEQTDMEGRAAIDRDILEHPHIPRKLLWMIRISGAFGDNNSKQQWDYMQRERTPIVQMEEQEIIAREMNRKLSERLAIERAAVQEIDRILALLESDDDDSD